MGKDPRAFLEQVFACVDTADREGLASERGLGVLEGLSGRKTVGVLQRLAGLFAADEDACYLEVGVFQGLTLLALALAHPRLPCFGVDDFSILDSEGRNLALVKERIGELEATNAVLINEGFETAFDHLDDHLKGRRIGLYFYDGAHDYRSQLMGLMLVRPFLTGDAVVVVDDANYEFVRQATRDFLLTDDDFKMVFEGYSPAHPANLDVATLKHHEAGWLNGVHVLARDPADVLPRMLPPVDHEKSLYVNDWLVHRHQFARLAPEALDLAQATCGKDAVAREKREAALRSRFAEAQDLVAERFPDRNTMSDGLPEGRFNPWRSRA